METLNIKIIIKSLFSRYLMVGFVSAGYRWTDRMEVFG